MTDEELQKKLDLICQWRDWHWHMSLRYSVIKEENQLHVDSAKAFHRAYRIMTGNLQSSPTIMKGYEDIKFGEFPKDKSVIY